ncbi:hypothetical protein [Cellulosilyticum lentocellum]|uniref:DUF4355 domain-containing protein n=1 Tax=Cellulosilyticum lentocellum (strain ATCC 49066 / DSM 5427 / NCIMB 11756 / RHM5) TaxID=642492 RepID=F2JSS6_CELLD|nr:hypothetical protein [Cellulosilyticum lentocellum]ADZ82910.1 hypothetical protein Clole_1181 [Cellulosilyticum lentocellum DSM 5427]
MKLEELQGFSEEQLEQIKKVIQSETDRVRTDYTQQLKDLEPYKPKEKSQAELDIEARLKAIEDREKAIATKEADEQFTTKFKEKGLPSQLAKYFKQGVEDVETYLDEVSNVFNELQLNTTFKPSAEHKSSKDVITKDQFKAMGYSDRVKLMETNRPLYDKLSSQQ